MARLRPHLSAMGITRIANVTGLDRAGIATVSVVRPNSRAVTVAMGKGVDLAAARVSGVMEAIEGHHAETIARPLRQASRAELARGDRLVDLERLPRQSPQLLPQDLPILWVEGQDLLANRSSWLPLETVTTDYTLPQPPGSGYFQATTNGLASGNSHDEALLHAVCEIVERDARTLWELAGRAGRIARRLDLATVDDPLVLELLERLARAEIAVAVWDVTTDIGLPCFVALLLDLQDGTDPELGSGCHPSPGIALCRALTEAAQARVGFISGGRDDLLPELYAPQVRARRAREASMWLAETGALRSFTDIPDLATTRIDEDLARVLKRIEAAGCAEVIAVDLTQPRFGIPVVRVVVPGLEGPLSSTAGWQPGTRARQRLAQSS